MRVIYWKTRTSTGPREQCALRACRPCVLFIGDGGHWSPRAGTRGVRVRCTFDGNYWLLQPESGVVTAAGDELLRPRILEEPISIRFGGVTLLVDDTPDPQVATKVVQVPAVLPRVPTRATLPIVAAAADDLTVVDPSLSETVLAGSLVRGRAAEPPALLSTALSQGRILGAGPARAAGPRPCRPGRWLRGAFAIVAVVAALGLAFALGAWQRIGGRAAAAAHPVHRPAAPVAVVTPKPVERPAAALAPAPGPAATTAAAVAPRPTVIVAASSSPKAAADAFTRGDYATALAHYRALAEREPNNQAYGLIITVLGDRVGHQD